MINYLKKRVEILINDTFLLKIIIIALAVGLAQLYLFAFEPEAIHPLPRAIFWLTSIFVIFFFGRIGNIIACLIYSNVMVYFIRYDNYTFAIFALIVFFSFREKKYLKWLSIVSYTIQVMIIVQLHHLSSFHLIIHLGIGLLIFYTFLDLTKDRKKELLLKVDEITILDYMKNGVKQNDINEFSAQTVSRKLKEARERNKLRDNDELLLFYKNQNKISGKSCL